MLRRRLPNFPSACLPRYYTSGGSRDGQLLRLLQSRDSASTRVTEALKNNFYALAAVIVAKSSDTRARSNDMQRIVRGLVVFDPRLLPVNLRALYLLHEKLGLVMDSVDKATLIDSLVEYGDPEVTRSGLGLLAQVEGGSIPISALMAISAHAKEVDSPGMMVQLWLYLRENYPRTLVQYSSLIVDMLETFSRKERYRPLARQVATMCLGGDLNPSLILSIAKASYMLQDDGMAARLCSKLKAPDERVTHVLAQLDAARGRAPRQNITTLPAQELSGVVKSIARRNIASGEQAVQKSCTEASHNKHREKLAKTALCNQYIHEGSFEKFIDTFRDLEKLELGTGILLNLRITWELHHGSFKTAKRHYQNWGPIPLKQRAIALKALEAMATGHDDQLQWVKAEKRIHSLR